jgi:hypothetical protein
MEHSPVNAYDEAQFLEQLKVAAHGRRGTVERANKFRHRKPAPFFEEFENPLLPLLSEHEHFLIGSINRVNAYSRKDRSNLPL